ncbi:MAG: DUF4159 domain-containing protein [Calditrichia bacterium]
MMITEWTCIRREMKKYSRNRIGLRCHFRIRFSHAVQFCQWIAKNSQTRWRPPVAFGLFFEGRMVAFYSYNTDISDGCEDADVHNDPPDVRRSALQMGTNILLWAMLQ